MAVFEILTLIFLGFVLALCMALVQPGAGEFSVLFYFVGLLVGALCAVIMIRWQKECS